MVAQTAKLNMSEPWPFKPLSDCLEKVKTPRKIPRKQFLEKGPIPIISQEAEFINGYWNNQNDVAEVGGPVVIFGDHTQVLKLIDFPFAVGADGVKILKPKKFLDASFLKYFLEANPLPSKGYARHFRHVKELAVPLPDLEEQKQIVAVLDQAFTALDRAQTQTLKNLEDCSSLLESFVEEQLDKSDGQVTTLQELLDNGSILSHLDGNHGSDYPRKEEFISAGIPYISANCIVNGQIDLSRAKYLSEERAAQLRKGIAQDGDVIFAHNASVGPVAILRTPKAKVILGTSVTYYRCNPNRIDPEFLLHEMRGAQFRRQYEAVMKQATRNQVPITAQRKLTHTIPGIARQRQIAAACSEVANHVRHLTEQYESSLASIDECRQTLLEKAFSGDLS